MADFKFYDVKTKTWVTAPVTGKKEYGEEGKKRYALLGKSEDGRSLNIFCSKADYDKFKVKVVKK